jgi:hypothetical protein
MYQWPVWICHKINWIETTRMKVARKKRTADFLFCRNLAIVRTSSPILNRNGISKMTMPFVGRISTVNPRNKPANVMYFSLGLLIERQKYQRNPLMAKKE